MASNMGMSAALLRLTINHEWTMDERRGRAGVPGSWCHHFFFTFHHFHTCFLWPVTGCDTVSSSHCSQLPRYFLRCHLTLTYCNNSVLSVVCGAGSSQLHLCTPCTPCTPCKPVSPTRCRRGRRRCGRRRPHCIANCMRECPRVLLFDSFMAKIRRPVHLPGMNESLLLEFVTNNSVTNSGR